MNHSSMDCGDWVAAFESADSVGAVQRDVGSWAVSMVRVLPGPFVALLLVIALAAGCSPAEQKHSLVRRSRTFEQLGQTLARLAPGSVVLVVGNPFAVRPGADPGLRSVEEASVQGLRLGLGQAASFAGVVCPELKPGALENPQSFPLPPGATTPLSFLTAAGAWDRLRERSAPAVSGPMVLVSLIGFPADLANTRAWTDPQGPRWALYLPDLRLLGSAEALRTAFRDRRLLVVILNRPGAPPESEPLADDTRADFERRYLLVTEANLDETVRAWPQLFPP